jgi:hypothetical protein
VLAGVRVTHIEFCRMIDAFRAGRASPILLMAARLALAAGLVASAPALTQDHPVRDVGAWSVAASQDGKGCFLTREYEANGGTTLLLGLDLDGGNHLSLLNPNWSIKPKTRSSLDFLLSNGRYSKHMVIGIASNGKNGFVTDFEARFPAHFAASKFLHVDRGDVPVERLSLNGSGAAVAELRRCVGAIRTKAKSGTRETKPSRRVPKDPFAPQPGGTRKDGDR